jgi:hypothetical protein
MDLPDKRDWDNWRKIEHKVVMIMHDHPIINVLPILIILDNWINYSRPPTRLEIQFALYDENIEGRNWWKILIPSNPVAQSTGKNISKKKAGVVKRPISGDHRLLQILEDRKLIFSQNLKEYKNVISSVNVDLNFHLGPTSLSAPGKKQDGRIRFYSLTPLGKIFLSVMLQKPWLAISLNREAVVRGYLTLSSMSWMYLKKPKEYPLDFRKNVNKELTKSLADSFWKLDTTVTRIIFEYSELCIIKTKCTGKLIKLKINEPINEFLKKIREEQIPHLVELEEFFPEKIICEEILILADSFLAIVEGKAKSEGLKLDDLNDQINLLGQSD